MLELGGRLSSLASSSKSAQIDTIMRLEAKLSAQAAEHERAVDAAGAAAGRRYAAALAEREEAARGLSRQLALRSEEASAASAAEAERARTALSAASEAHAAVTREMAARLDDAAAASARQMEDVTARLSAHAG